MKNYSQLKALISSLEEDVTKFYEKDNKAAGVRVRKGLQDIKALAQSMRNEVSEKNKQQ
jgi:hypothetical protein